MRYLSNESANLLVTLNTTNTIRKMRLNMKLFGSSLILAGTALGAGMLAIPMVLAQFGFLVSSLLMLVIFIGTTYCALLLTEVCSKTDNCNAMSHVAAATLGTNGKLFINSCFYLLLVCIMVAYLLGVGDLFHKMFDFVSAPVAYILFSLIVGAIVVAGASYVDKLNRALFLLMIAMLLILIGALMFNIKLDNLIYTPDFSSHEVARYSAMIFTSFGSMVVIPSLVQYNKEASKTELRNMILLGSVIPFICYTVWLMVIIGNLGSDAVSQFDSITDLIARFSDHTMMATLIAIFSALALITSFLGVSMALFDQNVAVMKDNKLAGYALTFILPLVIASVFSAQFLSMLDYAGIILVFLAVWGPLVMTIKVRQPAYLQGIDSNYYTVAGGNTALVLSFGFGALIFLSWLMA